MLKRIVILTAVLAPLSFAIALLYIDLSEDYSYQTNQPKSYAPRSGPDASVAYCIDREGRHLEAKAKTDADLKKAEGKYLEALRMFRKLKHPKGEAEVLNDLGIYYSGRRQYSKAEDYFKQALKIKREIGWHWAEGNTLASMAILYADQGQYSKAAEYYEQAIKAYQTANSKRTVGQMQYHLGDVYRKQGLNDKALESYEKSSEIASKAKDHVTQVKALNSLGKLYGDTDESAKAMECFQRALTIAKKKKYRLGLAHTLGCIASVHTHQCEYDKATPYLKECADIAKKTRNPRLEQWALHSLGIVYERAGETTKAIESFEKSLELNRKLKQAKKHDLLILFGRLAQLHFKSENYAKASQYCMEALEWARKAGASDLETKILKSLTEVYQKWKLEKNADNESLRRIEAALNKQVERDELNEQLFEAIRISDIDMARTLLAKGANPNLWDKFGNVPVEMAAKTGSIEMAQLLLDHGADLKKKNRYGRLTLEAAFTGAMFAPCHEKVARYFLDMGADVNAMGPGRRTALYCATCCSVEFMNMLIDKGAKVNAPNDDGETPLMATARNRDLEMTRLLLDRGADVNAQTNDGHTALMEVADGLGFLKYPALKEVVEDPDSHREAARAKSLEVVQLLVDRGADINIKGKDHIREGRTALMAFSVVGHPEIVKLLLEKGADVNAKLKDDSNALFRAIDQDTCFNPVRGLQRWVPKNRAARERIWSRRLLDDRQREVVKLLVTHGADLNARLKDGATVLSWVASLGDAQLVKMLLENGADVEAKLKDGTTPLMWAVCRGRGYPCEILEDLGSWSDANAKKHILPKLEPASDSQQIEVMKILLDHKADVNAKLKDGTTPLMWAAILGETEMVKMLLHRGADASFKLKDGSTALMWASLYKQGEVVKLLEHQGLKGNLLVAAMAGLESKILRLLEEGADVNTKDKHGRTPLMEAASGGHLGTAKLLLDKGADSNSKNELGLTPLMEAVGKGNLEVATLLLDRGADLTIVDHSGWPVLMQAAWKGQMEAVSLLISKGADVNVKDIYGKTPLMRAIEMGNNKVAALLIENGADVNAQEADGWSPVKLAATRKNMESVELLQKHGANMTMTAAALLGDQIEVQRLIEDAVKTNSRITDGPTALITAARMGHGAVVKLLLDKCLDGDEAKSYSRPALILAIRKGDPETVSTILNHGVSANTEDGNGIAAIIYAADTDEANIVHMLLDRGANPNAMGWWGRTPLLSAVRKGNAEMVKALLAKGAKLKGDMGSRSLMEVAQSSGNKEILRILKAHVFKQSELLGSN